MFMLMNRSLKQIWHRTEHTHTHKVHVTYVFGIMFFATGTAGTVRRTGAGKI